MTNKKITINDLAVMVQKGFVGVHEEMNERFEGVDEKFKGVHGEIKEVKNELLNVNARLDTMQLDFSLMRDDRHRIKLLEDDVAVLKKKMA